MSDDRPATTALVLDDREEKRYLLSSWLRRAGYQVVEARSGREAIEAARRGSVDVAVLDVDLPDMTGFDVCEAIRAHEATQWMPVILISAVVTQPEDRSEGLVRGADAYLVEPIEASELLATVVALIRRTDLRRRTLLTNERLKALNNATAEVHSASTEDQLLAAIIKGASDVAQASAIVAHRTVTDAETLVLDEHGGVVARSVDPRAVDKLLAPARVGVTRLATDDPALVPRGFAGVPFLDAFGEPMAALLVPDAVEAAADEVIPLLAQLALAASLARANMRALDIEHQIAVTLQQSLLPQAPPEVPGVQMTFRYVAAARQAQVGGDFYDAFLLGDRTLALAIGDVVGHSVHAAAIMGEIRHAVRSYAIDGYGPTEVVARLERLVARLHPGQFCSAIYGVIDLDTGTFESCNAGHLPLVHLSGADATFVKDPGAIVGIGGLPPTPTVLRLAPGDRLLMVTDGLVERRTESIDIGLERLRRAALELGEWDLDDFVDEVIQRVGPGYDAPDDIAVVGLQLLAAPASPPLT